MTPGHSRHVPMRRCAVCRDSLPQAKLVRFARDENGNWRLDPERLAGGRGIWVCRQASCHGRKALGRAFRAQAPEVAEQLRSLAETQVAHGLADSTEQERENRKASQDGGLDV